MSQYQCAISAPAGAESHADGRQDHVDGEQRDHARYNGFVDGGAKPFGAAADGQAAVAADQAGDEPEGQGLDGGDDSRFLLSVSEHFLGVTRLDTAYAALVDGLTAELTDWISAWEPTLTKQDCTVLAALGVNGILGARFATGLFRATKLRIPDDRYLNEWTAALAGRIDARA